MKNSKHYRNMMIIFIVPLILSSIWLFPAFPQNGANRDSYIVWWVFFLFLGLPWWIGAIVNWFIYNKLAYKEEQYRKFLSDNNIPDNAVLGIPNQSFGGISAGLNCYMWVDEDKLRFMNYDSKIITFYPLKILLLLQFLGKVLSPEHKVIIQVYPVLMV